jgi:hypothetical protein
MEALFSSGRVADIALGVMILEAVVLYALTARRGEGARYRALLANLAAGACLVIAVRLALVGADWPWIAAALAASLLTHSLDLAMRLRTPH